MNFLDIASREKKKGKKKHLSSVKRGTASSLYGKRGRAGTKSFATFESRKGKRTLLSRVSGRRRAGAPISFEGKVQGADYEGASLSLGVRRRKRRCHPPREKAACLC